MYKRTRFDVCHDYAVLDYLVKNPESYPHKIAREIGLHIAVVQFRLKVFKELGLVDVRKWFRHPLYRVTEKGLKYYEALKVIKEIFC